MLLPESFLLCVEQSFTSIFIFTHFIPQSQNSIETYLKLSQVITRTEEARRTK